MQPAVSTAAAGLVATGEMKAPGEEPAISGLAQNSRIESLWPVVAVVAEVTQVLRAQPEAAYLLQRVPLAREAVVAAERKWPVELQVTPMAARQPLQEALARAVLAERAGMLAAVAVAGAGMAAAVAEEMTTTVATMAVAAVVDLPTPLSRTQLTSPTRLE
jgi:hypothetical protein